ncbi:hypothetical protein [Pseudochrobactrum saccharolyticum]|uniref:hypothetical protein n=1 Tax=Pseudochrobactrum saccharolyticum TaxID=354352 RepID=UPI00276BFF75|nr:hypothetical protein [Pseudochrobactrum saccharolyticum]MDP8249599.1 hypothetical protein [Pseudochrobactrum saccharolyticum]
MLELLAGYNPLTNAGHIPYLFDMNTVDAFLSLIDEYCASVKLAEATVSSRLFNDGKRIASIRAGSDIGVRRLNAAIWWLSEHWPPETNWPSELPRPSIPPVSAAVKISDALVAQ